MAETMGECYEGIVAEIGPQIRKAYGEFINDDELKCMTDEDVASSILDIKITAVEAKCQEDEPICEALMHLASGAVLDTPCCVVLTREFWRAKNLLDALAEAAIAHRNDREMAEYAWSKCNRTSRG